LKENIKCNRVSARRNLYISVIVSGYVSLLAHHSKPRHKTTFECIGFVEKNFYLFF